MLSTIKGFVGSVSYAINLDNEFKGEKKSDDHEQRVLSLVSEQGL